MEEGQLLHSGQALDLSEGAGHDGANIRQWPDNGLDPQRWQFTAP
ncbi:Putative Glycoside hydrolase family 5 [Thermobacillus xylanilyticus]|jgi:hypothetical protein|uniref:Glycoside hydrolase family 5 n=1 Tax=Thermobacillus xylanilyticus TaxID=76633 RepID=A0ABM8V7G5_THEXY|nr:RICIN domain-containing protein [Thermobacillus xylanilyticus]CAG5091662.1 Putative Glycoside hydrolase family 5 [Thermobacillus xylanilyticus]